MKDELVTRVFMAMADKMGAGQCRELKDALYMALQDYEVTARNTELMDIERTYVHCLNIFLIRKQTEGKSARTIEQYEYQLKNLLQNLNMRVEDITENDLFAYLARYKQSRKVSNTYLDGMRRVFSSFFTWLNSKGYIPKNPTIGLDPIKAEQRIRKPFSDEELEKIREACNNKRDRALIEFLYSTGVRAAELTALNRSDIDFIRKSAVVYGKGGKEREVYLTATACLYLREYIGSRTDNSEPLFVGTRKPYKRLSVAGVEKIVKELGKAAGVENVHPHRFRRTMATNVLKKGAQLEEVRELLGHSKLDTTMIYCTINKEDIKHTHQKLMGA